MLLDMSDYTRSARIYWSILVATGILIGIWSVYNISHFSLIQWVQFGTLFGFVALLSLFPIRIPGASANITTSDLFVFLGIILLGVPSAILLTMLDVFISSIRLTKRVTSWLVAPSITGIALYFSGHIFYYFINLHSDVTTYPIGLNAVESSSLFLSLILMALMQYVLNNVGVSTLFSLKNGSSLWLSLKTSYLWTCWNFVAGAIGAGLIYLAIIHSVYVYFFVVVAIIGVTYMTYQIFFERVSEKIKELRLAEEALKKSEERFKAQYKGIPIPTYSWQYTNGEFRLVDFNDAAQAISNGKVAGLVGCTAKEHFGDRPDILNNILRCFQEKRIIKQEGLWLMKHTGETRYYIFTYVHVPPDIVMLHTEDITERKRAEAERTLALLEIESQRQRINNIIETVPGIVWEAWGQPGKSSQRMNFVSNYAEVMLGYGIQDWISIPNFGVSIIHSDDKERVIREIGEIFANGEGGIVQCRVMRKDGQVIWVETQMVVVRDALDTAIGMRGVTMDITERKIAEDALHRLADRLTTAQEDERRRISKELHDESGQALAAIDMHLYMLERGLGNGNLDSTNASKKISELRHIIQPTCNSLRSIAHALHPTVLEDFGLVEALRTYLQSVVTNTELEYSVSAPDSFPRFALHMETAIYRIMQEAITNALKYAQAKSIDLSFDVANGVASISIKDDGCGFDPQVAKANGGIGLISIRERADLIGAKLQIKSSNGDGTSIVLQVPFNEASQQPVSNSFTSALYLRFTNRVIA
jgi:PAS domain S-box-containing protein